MVRKISWHLYGLAFIFSLAVFIAGIMVGKATENSAMEGLRKETEEISSQIAKVQLLLLTDENQNFCAFYEEELKKVEEKVESIGYQLSYLEDVKGVYDNELKREYFAVEAQAYFLAERISRLCGKDYLLVINFYTNKNCEECKKLGEEVLKAREQAGVPVKLYSFDGEIGSSIAEGFKSKFNITTYPSLVVEGSVYEGYRSSGEIVRIFREEYDNKNKS